MAGCRTARRFSRTPRCYFWLLVTKNPSDIIGDLLDWLRQCRRTGLYEQGKAIYERGGLNLTNLSDEQQIEAEDDYRICDRRGGEVEAKPKKRHRKMKLKEE